jgi:methylated-DNA-[protein]-cysteine S-methyltransferase
MKIQVIIQKLESSPLGPVWVAFTDQGLWAIEYDVTKEKFLETVQRRGDVETIEFTISNHPMLTALAEYLNGDRTEFDMPIDWRGMTNFQVKVRQAVMAIPAGETSTYGQIAVNIGKPGAARAVGRVNATNPIPLVIPCHRVVGSDGNLIGYGGVGGVETKQWLLELEGN